MAALLSSQGDDVVESQDVVGMRVGVENGVETAEMPMRSTCSRNSGVVSIITLRPPYCRKWMGARRFRARRSRADVATASDGGHTGVVPHPNTVM